MSESNIEEFGNSRDKSEIIVFSDSIHGRNSSNPDYPATPCSYKNAWEEIHDIEPSDLYHEHFFLKGILF